MFVVKIKNSIQRIVKRDRGRQGDARDKEKLLLVAITSPGHPLPHSLVLLSDCEKVGRLRNLYDKVGVCQAVVVARAS